MKEQKGNEQQQFLWLASAMLAPLGETAAKNNWLVTLAVGIPCLLLCMWVNRAGTIPGNRYRWLLTLWNGIVVSELLRWSGAYWPYHAQRNAVPLILLALALWTVWGKGKGARIGCVLLWPVGIFLGILLLSGLGECERAFLEPKWQVPEGYLTVVLLLPALGQWGKKQEKRFAGILAFGILASVAAMGVLSETVSMRAGSAIWELSRSIRILGKAERFESITAMAMTMGYFVSAVYLMEKERKRSILQSAVSGALILGGITLDSYLLAIGCVVLWVLLPLAQGWKNIRINRKKALDK